MICQVVNELTTEHFNILIQFNPHRTQTVTAVLYLITVQYGYPSGPLSVESLTPRTSTYSTLRYELWKLERSGPQHRPGRRPGPAGYGYPHCTRTGTPVL